MIVEDIRIGQWYWVAPGDPVKPLVYADDPDLRTQGAAMEEALVRAQAAEEQTAKEEEEKEEEEEIDLDEIEEEEEPAAHGLIRAPIAFDDTREGRWLGCVVEIGSNYVDLKGYRREERIHLDRFDDLCDHEPDPLPWIAARRDARQQAVVACMEEIRRVTAELGAGERVDDPTSTALVAVHGVADVEAHKAALIRAKQDTLPALFEQLATINATWVDWLKVEMIPSQAQADRARAQLGELDDRIFTVELYAGLIEQVVQLRSGAPAAPATPLHLHQRRHYMDEECLANYRHGGMHMENLGDFEDWLIEPDNLERILPHPRSVVAFRVRRRGHEDREDLDWRSFIQFCLGPDPDKFTYLYFRNGERVYRLQTGIEFDAELFPDQRYDMLLTNETLYVDARSDVVSQRTIDDYNETFRRELATYPERLAEWRAKEAAHRAWKQRHVERQKAALRADGYDGTLPPMFALPDVSDADDPEPVRPYPWAPEAPSNRAASYVQVNRDTTDYDQAMAKILKTRKAHNRIATILQGLLDRSPVFQPHPPWRLWHAEDAAQALVLVYDTTRALTGGDAPDFEAYRRAKNVTIRAGSLVVGQEDAWLRTQADKRNARDRDGERRPRRRWRPPGNPGPGLIARVVRVKRNGDCVFQWQRTRQRRLRYSHRTIEETFVTEFACPRDRLFHVDAYVPGEYRLFYEDPRTRADYVAWAPLLLAAEDHHAHMTPATVLERKRAAAVRRFQRIHAERVATDAPNDRHDRSFNELPHVWFAHRDDESPMLQALITAWRFDSTDHVRFHLGHVPRGSTAAHVAALADDFAYQVHLAHYPGLIARRPYAVVAFTWPKMARLPPSPAAYARFFCASQRPAAIPAIAPATLAMPTQPGTSGAPSPTTPEGE